MKRLATAFALGSVFVAGSLVMGQGERQGSDDPFFQRGDRGETVRVLPPHASIRAQRDAQPIFARPSSGAQVYPASYGSGNLINHGGPQIGGPGGATFVAIYWNSQVANSTRTSMGYRTIADQIGSFITNFSGSNWSNSINDDYTIIQQYGVHDTISPALPYVGPVIDTKATSSSIRDGDIQRYLGTLFTSGRVQPNANALYGIYFPPGMRISMQGSSCSAFCGYHNRFTYQGIAIKYAVLPYLDCSACSIAGLTVADMLTIVTSHEIREAVTDPLLNGWYDAVGYEADDKCAWHNLYKMSSGSFWVQPEYSNGATLAGTTFLGPGCVVPNAAPPAPAPAPQHSSPPAR
jgi:hypothetical protein